MSLEETEAAGRGGGLQTRWGLNNLKSAGRQEGVRCSCQALLPTLLSTVEHCRVLPSTAESGKEDVNSHVRYLSFSASTASRWRSCLAQKFGPSHSLRRTRRSVSRGATSDLPGTAHEGGT